MLENNWRAEYPESTTCPRNSQAKMFTQIRSSLTIPPQEA